MSAVQQALQLLSQSLEDMDLAAAAITASNAADSVVTVSSWKGMWDRRWHFLGQVHVASGWESEGAGLHRVGVLYIILGCAHCFMRTGRPAPNIHYHAKGRLLLL